MNRKFLINLPNAIEFQNLQVTENLKKARETLQGLAGVYCIKCLETGTIYIGSSINLGDRIMDHLFYGSSNIYLRNAIAKQGVENFIFIVVEFFEPYLELSQDFNRSALLECEQYYLDWLFKLPAE